jgi:hypothetical protein
VPEGVQMKVGVGKRADEDGAGEGEGEGERVDEGRVASARASV